MNRPAPWRSIMGSVVDRGPFKVGGATVDPTSRDACWRGGKERLQPQTLKVLRALVSHRGQVVTRDELVQLCWDGRIVGDDVINRAILLLRHLAERAGGFEIETVPRTGYRLVEPTFGSKGRRRWAAVAVVVAIVTLATTLVLFNGRIGRPAKPMLAVVILPFTSDSRSAEALGIASQARKSAAHMLSESGVSVALLDPRGVSRTGADLLISGEVNGGPNHLVATVNIEDPARKAVVFSHRFEADQADSSALPDRIGANLAAALSWTAPLLILDRRHPSDPAFVTQLLDQTVTEDFDQMRAFQFARRAAPNAPDSAIAQLVFATDTGLTFGSLPREERGAAVRAGRQAADRALALAPTFGDAYIPGCLLRPQVLIAQCEDRLRAGLRADPDAPFVPAFLSRLLNNVGRTSAALDLAYTSLAADQYTPSKIGRLAGMLEATGNTQEADRLYRQGMRWWPTNHNMFWMRYSGIIQSGNFAELVRFEKEVGPSIVPPDYPPAASLAAALEHDSTSELRRACPRQEASPFDVRSTECMVALAETGNLDEAFAFADALYPDPGHNPREQEARWLAAPSGADSSYITAPATARLRQDPRFLSLAGRIGLLAYWRTRGLPDFCTKAHEPVCARITSAPGVEH